MTPSHSGPSDRLEASLAGFDVPAARPPDFPTADVSYAVDDTPIGRMLLACDGSGVLVASLFTPDAAAEEAALQRLAARISPRVLRRPQSLDEARRWLESYLDGGRPGAAPAWALSLATPFQIPVLTTLAARVGYGDRATYGQLASWAGNCLHPIKSESWITKSVLSLSVDLILSWTISSYHSIIRCLTRQQMARESLMFIR